MDEGGGYVDSRLGNLWGSSNPHQANAQRVLRNTYALLALTLVPTVLGAWIGMELSILSSLGAGLSLTLFLVVAVGLMFAIRKNKESGIGVALLLLFTGFMGLMMSPMLSSVLSKANGSALVMSAFGGTCAVMACMAALSSVIKRDLSWMGKFLFVGLLMLIAASIMNIFIQSNLMMVVLASLSIGLFSAFLLYDLKQILDGGETNYVMATLSIYLDLFNIFQNLLTLFGLGFGDD